MKSKDYILINGVSSDTLDIWIETPPIPPKPKLRTQRIVIPGREDIVTSNGEYEDITVNITAYVFERNFDPEAMYTWMEKATTLQTSLLNKYYYKVKEVNEVNPQYQGGGKYKLLLSFVCEPYKYSTDNPVWTTHSGTLGIRNNGNVVSKPTFIVTGSGDIGIEVNGEKVTAYGVGSLVYVDCERLVCYEIIDNKAKILTSSGIYPKLDVGHNDITITGSVTQTQLQVNARWI